MLVLLLRKYLGRLKLVRTDISLKPVSTLSFWWLDDQEHLSGLSKVLFDGLHELGSPCKTLIHLINRTKRISEKKNLMPVRVNS